MRSFKNFLGAIVKMQHKKMAYQDFGNIFVSSFSDVKSRVLILLSHKAMKSREWGALRKDLCFHGCRFFISRKALMALIVSSVGGAYNCC